MKKKTFKIEKKNNPSSGLWTMDCPCCGKTVASAAERNLLPEWSVCDCDEPVKTGNILITSGINEFMVDHSDERMAFKFWALIHNSFVRHTKKDWGDVGKEDWEENNYSLNYNYRLLSSYNLESDLQKFTGRSKIWIITEWNRSFTTILFPDEY